MSRRDEIIKSAVRRQRELAEGGTSDLFELIDKSAAHLIVAALSDLSEQRRREVGVELTAWVKRRERDQARWWTASTGTALAVAVVGCLP
ncbi:hypothetical protein ABT336_08440, partial [Micromonospora sp. NPDC000207]|uniref:hypothetical protein n=1 Tax=Micromonospora sp. NPDC000207 TaxID=3154246 RepID=UPI00331E8DBD